MKTHLTRPLKNQRGLITVDFLFSLVLILGFAGLMFALTLTLTMASVTQYVTFAAARNYFTGHIDRDKQIERANQKYLELLGNPVFKPLYTNGWFIVDAQPFVGDHTTVIPQYQDAAQVANKFWGAGTNFTATILDFNIPFFGSTAPDGDGTGAGFKTYMGSYLGREPTTAECLAFVDQRWQMIRNLKSSSGGASYSTGTPSSGGYYPQTDDGC
jgi:hypothetical protein